MTLLNASGEKHYTVVIATPCQDTVSAGYAYDLARLVGFVAANRPDIALTIVQNRGTILPLQRAALVKVALERTATHVLWLDSDMRFPPDTLTRLLSHEQPIVAANYSTRRPPILPTAEHTELGSLFTTSEDTGLVEVTHVGMGCMLVQMDVYAQTPEPWFAIAYHASNKGYVGEDVFFCKRSSRLGFKTLIDQSLSREVRHVGEMEFRAEHALVTRDTLNRRTMEAQANGV